MKMQCISFLEMTKWFANKFAKFHAGRLNQTENIPKSFRGLLIWNTLYVLQST